MNEQLDPLAGRLILGIDLGTTNSGVAAWCDASSAVVVLPDADGAVLLPSAVGWDAAANQWLVGRPALELRQQHPSRVATSVKRFLGRWWGDPAVAHARQDVAYRLLPGPGDDPLHDVVIDFGTPAGGPRLSAPEVSAHVLGRLRRTAAAALGLALEDINRAVITVPAYFNVLQRRATILAGQRAGLDVVDILNEPTAAALAYGDTVLGTCEEKRILVCDLGGGTYDVSLLEASRDGDGYVFTTVAVDGDTRLGGDDIDAALARWLAREAERQHGRTFRLDDPADHSRLWSAAERAKIALTEQNEVEIELPEARLSLGRDQLEACARDVLRRVTHITRRAVEDVAGLRWHEIDEVILVGGQTLMPAVRGVLTELWGKPPRCDNRPQLAVALGAGEYARILSRGRGRFHQNSLINVIALPLGIRLDDDTFEPLVPANATVPFRSRPLAVTTLADNQTRIRVEVLQGPRAAQHVGECVALGCIEMEVPPAPARTPKFEVVFEALADGTLHVAVTDTRRDRQAAATLSGGLVAWKGTAPRMD